VSVAARPGVSRREPPGAEKPAGHRTARVAVGHRADRQRRRAARAGGALSGAGALIVRMGPRGFRSGNQNFVREGPCVDAARPGSAMSRLEAYQDPYTQYLSTLPSAPVAASAAFGRTTPEATVLIPIRRAAANPTSRVLP
jgi:hypothetical protein